VVTGFRNKIMRHEEGRRSAERRIQPMAARIGRSSALFRGALAFRRSTAALAKAPKG
jgi:hypothetical protein